MITKNAEKTKKLGAKLAASLKGGEVLAFYGDLGAGKTTFIQGLAQGLGIKEPVQSPTFILLSVYKVSKGKISAKGGSASGGKNLKRAPYRSEASGAGSKIKYFVHVDAYRLKNAAAALTLGLTDYLGRPDTVVVIEWAEKLEEILKNYQVKKIRLSSLSAAKREITFSE